MLQHTAIDRVFKALGDANRRSLVERLSAGPAAVSELARPLDMTLSAVGQHLRVLEAAQLVRSEKVGRVRTYRLDSDTLATAEHWLADRRGRWEQRLDHLGAYLTADAPPGDPDD